MSKFAGFSSVQLTRPLRSSFDLSHQVRLTTRMGRLTPVLIEECVPSDTFRGSSEILLRLAPLLAPIYDQIQLYVHFFFVPNRLLWEDWEEFITGGRLGPNAETPAPIPPCYEIEDMWNAAAGLISKSSLHDYLGGCCFPELPGQIPANYSGVTCDLMPYLAYQLCFYEYYRDRNFVPDNGEVGALYPGEFPVASGIMPEADAQLYLALQRRSWEHDYFTSALPFTQRGDEVLIPVEGTVTYLQQSILKRSDTGDTLENNDLLVGSELAPSFPPGSLAVYNNYNGGAGPGGGVLPARIENIDSISNANTTIEDFRSAYALQVWLERNAIGGSRYTESVQAHFGVKPQDSRMQRPEYIGGGRINVQISEVVSTSYSENAAEQVIPQANLAGRGVTYGNTNQFNYFCTEHGFIIGIASIMNPPGYQQGQPRMFRRRSFLDYPWPTFAKLGEQPVYDFEIFATGVSMEDEEDTGEPPIFGYQSRYADWKYRCSRNAGDFRDTLLFWTLTRVFADAPVLGAEFNYVENALQDRIFAVQGQDSFWLYVHNNVHVKRPLPYFGTPNTLGFV